MTPPNNKTKSKTLKLVAASVALAGLAYGSYAYLTKTINEKIFTPEDDISNEIINNNLIFKQDKNISISLTITSNTLAQISKYNEIFEDGIDIQTYLSHYPNLIIILSSGLKIEDIEEYFEISNTFKSRILNVDINDSIFHILKQLKCDLNLIDYVGLGMDPNDVEDKFKLGNFVNGVVDLNGKLFTDFI